MHRLTELTEGLDTEIVLLESESRLGGKIKTSSFGDTQVDEGADAFLLRTPHAVQLAAAVGLGEHLVVDITEDVRRINDIAVRAAPHKTGVIILGGGVPKHHIFNANLMRNGSDFCTIISTATEWDGSDSGARPDEAISWGKIKLHAAPVKCYGDATILFPLLVSQTFAKNWNNRPRAK